MVSPFGKTFFSAGSGSSVASGALSRCPGEQTVCSSADSTQRRQHADANQVHAAWLCLRWNEEIDGTALSVLAVFSHTAGS